MAKARVGVIGSGWWATHAHLPSLTTYADAEVVGLADLDGERARITADAFGVPNAFSDHMELLELELELLLSDSTSMGITDSVIFSSPQWLQ